MKEGNKETNSLDSMETSFGRVLKELRQNQAFSQEELGFRSGYHRTYISLLERGLKSPSLNTIFQMANALGISPSGMISKVEQDHFEMTTRGHHCPSDGDHENC
jgi:transcriptional regulator with XRE-family HTH domain